MSKIKDIRVMAVRGRSKGNWHSSKHKQQIEIGSDICNAITSVAKDNFIIELYDESEE